MIGAPYIIDNHAIRNQYLVRIVNKRNTTTHFIIHLKNIPGGITQSGLTSGIDIAALSEVAEPLILQQEDKYYKGAFIFNIELEDGNHAFSLTRSTEFLGPDPSFKLK